MSFIDDMLWTDNEGMMYPGGENGILFTAEYCMLKDNEGFNRKHLRAAMNWAISHVTHGKNGFKSDPKEPWSHDNHTGLICISKRLGLEHHKKFFYDGWWRRIHPRDLVFYLVVRGGLMGLLTRPFLFITSIAMILSCLQSYKVRGGRKIVKTDGKILAWMRFNTINMPITKYICTRIVNKHKYFNGWRSVFTTYFVNLEHPILKCSDEAFE